MLIASLAVLAPLSYLVGRLSAGLLAQYYLDFLGTGLAATSLGVMAGIPIGLFFGSLRSGHVNSPAQAARPNTIEQEHEILAQIRQELAENKALFDARKGSTTLYARIAYITPFWDSIMASGRLFVMQNVELLNTIATAYYWLDQATRIEALAYERKYAPTPSDDPAVAAKLIAEARLLDGQIENSINAALKAIDSAQ